MVARIPDAEYERFINAVDGKPIATQQSLFPATMDLAAADVVLLKEWHRELTQLIEGFRNEMVEF